MSWSVKRDYTIEELTGPQHFIEPEGSYYVCDSLPLIPILNQKNRAHTLRSSFKIHFNIILSPLDRCLEQFFPSGFCTKTLYIFLFSPCVVCHAHLLNLIIWIFGDMYKSWKYKIHNFLSRSITYSLNVRDQAPLW